MNSGPLSERMWPGTPRRMNRSESTSMTSIALSLRSTRIARHSWVNSSMMLSIVGAVLDKVVGPDVVGVLRSQADAGAVGEPKASTLRLLGRDLQPLAPPDPHRNAALGIAQMMRVGLFKPVHVKTP